ncbi:MAG: transposase, partial [Pseudomonadota bacterium]
GAIPESLDPIMHRLKIEKDHWLETVEGFGRMFFRAAGRPELMRAAAQKAGLSWLRGVRAGGEAFYK